MTVEPSLKRPISSPCASRTGAGSGRRSRSRHPLALPHGIDTGHDHGAHQHQRHRPGGRIEIADQSFIAGEQSVNALSRRAVDRKQLPRHVAGRHQLTLNGHVYAVIIAGGQIDSGKVPVAKLCRARLVPAQQRPGGIPSALGLQQAVFLYAPDLAHSAIGRVHQAGTRQRPHPRTQRAGKKSVEIGVGLRIALLSLVHVHAKRANKRGDHPVFQPTRVTQFGQPAYQAGERVLWNQVLQQNENSVHRL